MVCGCLAKPVEINKRDSELMQYTGDFSRVYWSDALDWKNPLFTEEDRTILVKKMRTLSVVSLEEGCGRMKNRLATLEDGTRVCCRYRENGNQLRGDVYAYHFNRLLGMWNIPATLAVRVDLSSKQWQNVKATAIDAGWKNGVSIVASQLVDELNEEYFPFLIKNTSSMLPLTAASASNLTISELKRLMGWTDMILFDYVIGHTDRLFNALLNSRWNSHMMEKPVHNLKKISSSSDLVLLDNESGFDFGYVAAERKEEYLNLQIAFLERICVFRSSTINALRKLGGMNDDKSSNTHPPPSTILDNYIRQTDPLSYSALWKWKTQSQREFDKRVRIALERVQDCMFIVT